MARTKRYELGFNWAAGGDSAFSDAVADAAAMRRLSVLIVRRRDHERVRRDVEKGAIRIGLFLNTQADGTNRDSPAMLLCRALKARGTLVVEDPDDAPVYADRALQFEYLSRAGVSVPRQFVVESWQPGKAAVPAAARPSLGATWTAVPGFGLDRRKAIVSTARHVSPALARGGFKPGQKIIVHRHGEPATDGEREMRFRLWYLFGQIVPAWRRTGHGVFEPVHLEDAGHDAFAPMIGITRTAAELTGLDWFVIEMIVTGSRTRADPIVVEPANALAGLGPGVAVLRELGGEIAWLVAERLVDAAWRRARELPLVEGTAVLLA